MQEPLSNSFKKGMNKDVDSYELNSEIYSDALNMTPVTGDAKNGPLNNYYSNEFRDNLTCIANSIERELIPLGYDTYDGVAYIFAVTKAMAGQLDYSVVGTFPSPNYGVDNTFVQEFKPLKVLTAGADFVVSEGLLLDKNNPVEVKCRLEYNGTVNVYFVDGVTNGVINNGFEKVNNTYVLKAPTPYYNPIKLESQLALQPTPFKILEVGFTDIIEGNLLPGSYIFYFSYMDEGYNETPIVAQSFPIPIWQNMHTTISQISGGEIDGSGNFKKTGHGIQLLLNDVDTDFKFIQVYFERKYDQFGDVSLYYKMDSDNFVISGNSMIVKLTGNEVEISASSIDEINNRGANIKSAVTNTQLDNKYYMANITENVVTREFEDLLEFSASISLTEPTTIPKAKINNLGVTNIDELYQTTITEANGGYAHAKNVYNKLGFFPGEAYLFGIQFLLPDMSYTGAYPVDSGIDNFTSSPNAIANGDGIYRFKDRLWGTQNALLNTSGESEISLLKAIFPAWNDSTFIQVRQNTLGFRLVRSIRNKQCEVQGFGIRGFQFPGPKGHNAGDEFYSSSGIENREYRTVSGGYKLYDDNLDKWVGVAFPAFLSEIAMTNYVITNRTKGSLTTSLNETLQLEAPESNHGWDSSGAYGLEKKFQFNLLSGEDEEDDFDSTQIMDIFSNDTTRFVNIHNGSMKFGTANNHVRYPGYGKEGNLLYIGIRPFYVNFVYDIEGKPLIIMGNTVNIVTADTTSMDGEAADFKVPNTIRAFTLDTNSQDWCLFANDNKTNGTNLINKFNYQDCTTRVLGTVNYTGGMYKKSPFDLDKHKRSSVNVPKKVDYLTTRSAGNVDWKNDNFRLTGKACFVQNGFEANYSTPNGFTAYLDFISFNYGRLQGVAESLNRSWRDAYGIIRDTFTDDYIGLKLNIDTSTTVHDNNLKIRNKFFGYDATLWSNINDNPLVAVEPQSVPSSQNIAYDNPAYAATVMNVYGAGKWIKPGLTIDGGESDNLVNLYDFENETFIPITQPMYWDISDRHSGTNRLTSQTLVSGAYNANVLLDNRVFSISNIAQGDNYVGMMFHRLYASKWSHPSLQGTQYSTNGSIIGVVNDSNFNPYLRTDFLFNTAEQNYKLNKSVTTLGIKSSNRTFFPYYTGILNNKVNLFDFAFHCKIPETNRKIYGQSSQVQSLAISGVNVNNPFTTDKFPTRIFFSARHQVGDPRDGYRNIEQFDFADYDLSKGPIMKLMNFKNQLFSFQNSQINRHEVNDRIEVAADSVGPIYATTEGRLSPYPQIVSGTYGVQYTQAVCRSNDFIYGVDSSKKKIFQISAGGEFKILTDLVLASFLNGALNTFSDKVVDLSSKNIHCAFNDFNGDVYFTFFDYELEEGNILKNPESCFTICYNERTAAFSTFNSFIPAMFIDISDKLYSVRGQKRIVGDSLITWDPLAEDLFPVLGEQYEQSLIDTASDSIYVGQQTLVMETEIVEGVEVPTDVLSAEASSTAEDSKTAFSIWQHNMVRKSNGDLMPKNVFYDRLYKNVIEYVVNNGVEAQKILNNIEIISNHIYPDKIEFIVEDVKMMQDIKYHPQMRRIRNAVFRVDRIQIQVRKLKTEQFNYQQDVSDVVNNIVSVINSLDIEKRSRVRSKSITIRITYLKNNLKKLFNTDNSGDIRISKINSFIGITKF